MRKIRGKEFGLLKKNQEDKLELEPAGSGKSCEGVWTLIRAVSDTIQFLFLKYHSVAVKRMDGSRAS